MTGLLLICPMLICPVLICPISIGARWRCPTVCERVQRGLQSKAYNRGRFSVEMEQGVYHFQRLLKRPYRQRHWADQGGITARLSAGASACDLPSAGG